MFRLSILKFNEFMIRNLFRPITVWIIFFAFPLICYASDRLSDRASYCVEIFRAINDEIRSGYVSPQTRERVVQLFHDKKVPPEKRARKIFAQIVSDRLKLLSKKESKIIRNFLGKNIFYDYQESGSPVFAGFFDEDWPNKKEIILSLPVDLKDTIVEYTLLTHELEHVIQSLIVQRNKFGKHRYDVERLTHFVDVKYEKELGAMLSEFEYFNSIPFDIRKRVLSATQSHPEFFDPDTAKLISILLDNESKNPMDHVKRQHESGRYDRASIQASQDEALFFGSLIFLGGATESDALKKIAQQLTEVKEACEKIVELDKKDLLPLCQQKGF